jgi:hypothetical protein
MFLSTIMIGMAFSCKPSMKQACGRQELDDLKTIVEKQIQNEARRISDQLTAFSKVVAADRDFSMKLFVEGNRSAPEVTDITHRFMEPMGLSILEITDSAQVLLSCAEFPASTGTKVSDKAALLGEQGRFIFDNVKGQKVLTLQAQIRFKILDTLFYCIGGRIIDDAFVLQLSPENGFRLVLKADGIMGMNAPQTISDIKDSSVVVNATVYPAASISLPFVGGGKSPVLLLINEKMVNQKS